jgi:hypothetical protein
VGDAASGITHHIAEELLFSRASGESMVGPQRPHGIPVNTLEGADGRPRVLKLLGILRVVVGVGEFDVEG